MEDILISGVSTVLVCILGGFGVLMLIMTWMTRDQDSLKGPVLAFIVACAAAAGSYHLYGMSVEAKDRAYAERFDYLSEKYGVEVEATDEVTDLEMPGKWRIGNKFRPCRINNSDLTLDDPKVLCQFKDGKFYELTPRQK